VTVPRIYKPMRVRQLELLARAQRSKDTGAPLVLTAEEQRIVDRAIKMTQDAARKRAQAQEKPRE
jgi:hypothetical protein